MKKLSSIIIALLLGIVTLFGIAGCSSANQKELQSKIDEMQSKIEKLEESLAEKNEQISKRDERIEKLDNKISFLQEQIRLQNLTDWQRAADENTFIVSVNTNLLKDTLTAEKLSPVEVTQIFYIDGITPRSSKDRTKFALYTVRTKDASDDDLSAIQQFEFVDFAWRNKYDYTKMITPSEEKKYCEIQDYWIAFQGAFAVYIDKSYKARIFTAADFCMSNNKSVEWSTYDDFKEKGSADDYIHGFLLTISEYTDAAAHEGVNILNNLDFVSRLFPIYGVTDFPGYPG